MCAPEFDGEPVLGGGRQCRLADDAQTGVAAPAGDLLIRKAEPAMLVGGPQKFQLMGGEVHDQELSAASAIAEPGSDRKWSTR